MTKEQRLLEVAKRLREMVHTDDLTDLPGVDDELEALGVAFDLDHAEQRQRFRGRR